MKNNISKIYTTLFFLLVSFVSFAQPGDTGDGTGGLEGTDPAAAPIDSYVWVLAAIGLVFIFLRLRAFAQQENNLQE